MPCKSVPSRQLSGNRCWAMSLPFWPPNTWHWHCFRSMAQMATGRTEVQGPYHGPSMIQCSPVQNLVRTRLQAHAAHARMNAIEVSVWHHPQQDKPLSKELERNLRSWYTDFAVTASETCRCLTSELHLLARLASKSGVGYCHHFHPLNQIYLCCTSTVLHTTNWHVLRMFVSLSLMFCLAQQRQAMLSPKGWDRKVPRC